MEMNEFFTCDASAAVDEISPLPLPLPLPLTLPPPLHIHSSSTSWDSFLPLLNVTPHFHLEGGGHGGGSLDFDSVLLGGSLPTLPSCNDESLVIGRLFGGNVLPVPRTSHSRHHLPSPGAAKFSCFDGRNPPPVQNVNAPALFPGSCDSPNCKDELSRSLDGSSISEQVTGKRKCLDRGKAKEPSKFAEGGDDSVITTIKRSREDEELDGGDDIGPAKQPRLGNEEDEEEEGRKKKKSKKGGGGGGGGDGVEPPKDYIHVRARRGQATDSHSLAERVRREKISERMKMLQDLVPTCSKVTGKALMLDEIINYVQSLQRQVEFLSMKLASVNTNMNARIISKDMFQSSNNTITTTTSAAAQLPMLEPPLHEKMQEGTNFQYSADPPLPISRIPPLNGLDDQILAPFRGEDLHSIVEMGLFGQTNHLGFAGQGQMNNNNNMNMEELQQ